MLRKLFIVTLALFAVLLSACDSGPKISPLNASSVILAFGDSLTHGTGAPQGQSYPNVLSSLLGHAIINAGVPGETTSGGVKRISSVLDEHQPSLVILCEGGNDFLRQQNAETTRRNLNEMIAIVKASGAELILVGVPRFNFGLEVPDFYPQLAEEHLLPYEGEILVDLLSDRRTKSDRIHPNATGYRLMAEAIHEVINKAQK